MAYERRAAFLHLLYEPPPFFSNPTRSSGDGKSIYLYSSAGALVILFSASHRRIGGADHAAPRRRL